ncbi:hypothetical protein [Cohnella fermenti]|uniref:Uncharacterized protein n=1 Tax=Cohnella fermenti TaxID=2565925 RepID=A0A4S4BEQ9_9BACL|nr:hypothetical protein [Cohnella fermenti]THF72128.1 hypothetical protein E6C55_33500 [Cohnella fermenti]
MSRIQAELSRLTEIGQDVERMDRRAATVAKEVSTVGSRVEGAILARRGLSGRIGGSASGIGRIEKHRPGGADCRDADGRPDRADERERDGNDCLPGGCVRAGVQGWRRRMAIVYGAGGGNG